MLNTTSMHILYTYIYDIKYSYALANKFIYFFLNHRSHFLNFINFKTFSQNYTKLKWGEDLFYCFAKK